MGIQELNSSPGNSGKQCRTHVSKLSQLRGKGLSIFIHCTHQSLIGWELLNYWWC